MMTIAEIESQVRRYILESFLTEADAENFGDDDDLLKILDSLQILRMLIALEAAFRIKVQDRDLSPENLGSVKKIAALLARKSHDYRSGADGRSPAASAVDQAGKPNAVGR
jgi:acyl carrier protein